MAKLVFFLATAFAALLLADASIYRTTVVIEDETNPRGTEMDCMQQYQQQQKLMHCKDYMRYKMQRSPRGMNPQSEQEHLHMCCDQLSKMDSMCRCKSLEYAMQDMRQSGGQQMQGMQEMMRVAQQIPSMCRMSPGQCQFGQPLPMVEANPTGMDCMQQFQQQQKLMNCQDYMRYKMRQSQRGMNPQSGEEYLEMCCNQLQKMDSMCRCESLEYAMKDMQQRGGQQMQGMQEMMRVAREIPSMCRMSPGQCQFGQPLSSF